RPPALAPPSPGQSTAPSAPSPPGPGAPRWSSRTPAPGRGSRSCRTGSQQFLSLPPPSAGEGWGGGRDGSSPAEGGREQENGPPVQRAIVTVGLGFGDEGKGAAVDFLCRRFGADLVVRYGGGSQAGHNVQLPDGRRHAFSQFGAGTLAGVKTYLGPRVVLHPTALIR